MPARKADGYPHDETPDQLAELKMSFPKPPYRERKERYIAHLEHAPAEVLLVSCADKLHNARAIVADLRVMGVPLFERFNGKRDGTLWYYDALAEVFGRKGPEQLAAELRRTVETMKTLAV